MHLIDVFGENVLVQLALEQRTLAAKLIKTEEKKERENSLFAESIAWERRASRTLQ